LGKFAIFNQLLIRLRHDTMKYDSSNNLTVSKYPKPTHRANSGTPSYFGTLIEHETKVVFIYLFIYSINPTKVPVGLLHTSDPERGGLRRHCRCCADRIDGNALIDAFVRISHVSDV